MNLRQIWSERKKIVLLGLLILLLLILWSRQTDLIPPSPVGRAVRKAIYPVRVAVEAIDRLVERAWLVVMRSKDLEEKNRELKEEVALWRVRYQQLAEAHAQLERLSQLTAAQPTFGFSNVVANIIGISSNFWTRTVTIDRGRRDGVAPGMPVVNQEGLVGIVRDVTDHDALVQLLVDPEFGAGALVSETRDRGIVEGTGELDSLRLILENPQVPLKPGLKVATSGLPAGSLFPKGFLVGTIEATERNKFGQPYGLVTPVVRFERLEEVVVLLDTRREEIPPEQLPLPPP